VANKQTSGADTLEQVTRDFKAAWDYTSASWHSRWKDDHDLYNGNRTKRGYQGITDTFVPMPYSIVETLTAALFGTKPKYDFLAPKTKPDQKTDILNGLLDFFWDKDQWSVKNIHIGRSTFKLGMGIAYYYWENDHPCKIVVPVRDFFIDSASSNGEDARFMGRRYLITKAQLEEYEIVDFDKPEFDPMTGEQTYPMKKKYQNLDKITVSGGEKGDNTDKQEKDIWYGSTFSEPKDDQIEVIEHWTPDRVVSVANRSVIIEDAENYFKAKARANGSKYPKGIMPFAWSRDITDESLFYAKGEIDVIADQVELLNDQTNQRNDAIIYSLNQMYTLDPRYADIINTIENLPGAVYPVEKDALSPILRGSIPPDSFNESQNVKNEIREATGSNEVLNGTGSQAGSDPTATEINAQMMGAGNRINLKVTQLENEFFHREARIVLEMVKLYVTEPTMVRILGKDGAQWDLFDPSEFQDDYEPHVQLDIEVQRKSREEAMQAKEMLAAFMGDPDINQQEMKKLVLRRSYNLDPDEVELLLQPAPMMPPMGMDPAMMGQDPMMGDPSIMPMEDMNLPTGQPLAGNVV
jgi:hypothetical protein